MFLMLMEVKYMVFWFLQGLMFAAMILWGLMIEDPWEPIFVIGAPAVAVVSLVILAISYWRVLTTNGRRIWVYFFIFLFIVSGIASPIIMFFDQPDQLGMASFLLIWGAVGFVISLIAMPIVYIISNRRGGKPRPRPKDFT